jgi:hypothetical protein
MPAKSIDIGARVKVTVPLGKGLSNRFVKDKDRRHQPKQLDQITTLTSNDENMAGAELVREPFNNPWRIARRCVPLAPRVIRKQVGDAVQMGGRENRSRRSQIESGPRPPRGWVVLQLAQGIYRARIA